jgi:intracellular sulfur oxidation DsrE/DsrF family protein
LHRKARGIHSFAAGTSDIIDFKLEENKMKTYLKSFMTFLFLVLAATLQPLTATAEDSSGDVEKVVYHADFSDPRRFSAMLTSINNMVTYYQNELLEYDVRIVFVAHGIRFLTDDGLAGTPFASDEALEERRSNIKGRLSALNSVQGVKLELCDITRSQLKLPKDKLYAGVTIVPSGVVRLAELQHQGFAYIKIE